MKQIWIRQTTSILAIKAIYKNEIKEKIYQVLQNKVTWAETGQIK